MFCFVFVVVVVLILCIYLWLHWVFVAVYGLSLVAAMGDTLYVVVHATLIAIASLVLKHGFQGAWASLVAVHGLQSAGLVAVTLGLSCPMVCGNFLDQGSNPWPLLWQVDSLPLDY